jgi:hypothetical protein
MRTAASRYGTSSALTTKPALSRVLTTSLPRVPVTKRSARATVSGEVSSDGTSSTRRRAGTGLKKCTPTTCSGRPVAEASRMTGMEDHLDHVVAE